MRRGWELTKRIFLRMRDVLDARGAKLLVIATRFDPENSNEVIRRPSLLRKRFLTKRGSPYVLQRPSEASGFTASQGMDIGMPKGTLT